MKYNIDFEISAAFMLVVFYIFHRIKYDIHTKNSKLFRILIVMLFVCDVSDMFTCLTASGVLKVSMELNTFLNSLYLFVAPTPAFLLCLYTKGFVKKTKLTDRIALIAIYIYITYIVMIAINSFTGIVFYFDENGMYTYGSIHSLAYVPSICYLLTTPVMALMEKETLTLDNRIAFLVSDFMAILGAILQMIWLPYTPVCFFGGTMAVIILVFTLETPDYMALQRTMDELKAARVEADKANRVKSEFLSSMSHEIRTPLNAIMGIGQIIEEQNRDAALAGYLRDIKDAGDTLVNLVDNVLDTSKIETGEMEMVNAEYSVADMIHRVYSMIRFKAEEKHLDFEIEADPLIPAVLIGDEARIRQIMLNLLSNAVLNTDKGSITMEISFDRTEGMGMNLLLSVSEAGLTGEANEESLISSFSDIDSEDRGNAEGPGLGLRLVKNFTEMMGGTVTLRSTSGPGALLMVSIPQQMATNRPMGDYKRLEKARRQEQLIVENRDFSAYHVLIVDDMSVNILVAEGLLKSTGIKTDSATSGKECLELTAKNKYDIILLDHMMPGMDGVETLQKMNEAGTVNKDTPVVALTANVLPGAREAYKRMGFCDYLSKPVSKGELIELLAQYLH